MPAAAISLLPGVQTDWRSPSAGLAPALLSALPASTTIFTYGDAAAATSKHEVEEHPAAPAAAAPQQQLHTSADRKASAHAPADWQFFQRRRAPFGAPGRRSFERPEGGMATALAEQRRRRERRRDGMSTAVQRAWEPPQAADAQGRKLRSRELSGARLQQGTAVAEVAHTAVTRTVAEMSLQHQRLQSERPPAAVSPVQPAAAGRRHLRAAPEASAPEQSAAAQAPAPQQPWSQPTQQQQQPAEHAPRRQQQPAQQEPAAEQPAMPPLTQPQQTGGLSFMVSDASDWALRQRSFQVETPQTSLPLCLQWMDALGSGDIPLLVPSDTLPSGTNAAAPAAPSGPPPLPPAPPASMEYVSSGPPVAPLPKLKTLRSRVRRRAKNPSFPATPEQLHYGSSSTPGRLARSISNCGSSSRSSGDTGRHASGNGSSTPSLSPFAAFSGTPFEDDE